MKEDAQLICPIGYDDKSNVWPTIQKFVCDRLPLKDVVWKSPISSSFVNIEKLPIRFLPSSAKLFNETQHPYRRFLAPYVHVYLLCVESMDAYKTNKPFIKKWMEPYNNPKIGKQPWLIVYVPLGTSTMDIYQKVYARLSADFYTEKSGDRSVMLILPPDTGSKRTLSVPERFAQQGLYQQSYASIADLLGKLRDGVVTSFQIRTLQYDADIRKLDAARGLPNFDFWQLFLVKESLALMYQMLQLPDRALSLYEELEMLLVFAPAHSLPASDWPVVIPSSSSSSSSSGNSGSGGNSASGSNTPVKSTSRTGEPSQDADALPPSGVPQITTSKSKRDLMTDACRSGEDIMVYSINTARMNILWNKFSLFQLQHYIFARQMYFLLVHLRQPTRCAEKALQYMKSSYVSLEGRIQRQFPVRENVHALTEADLVGSHGAGSDSKMLQLRKAQADVWAVCASIKLIRECRALLQLLLGGDAKYNSVFNNNNSMSYNHNSVSASSTSESFSDNLAAISSASSHGSSVVYNSLAELNRSQHGIASHRKHTSSTASNAVDSSAHSAYTTPAMAIREILFAPELDIAVELRDSSRVLGDLIEFALKRLQALSSSTVKNASKKALDLALSTVPFDYHSICNSVNSATASKSAGVKRTVTKVATGGSGAVIPSKDSQLSSAIPDTQSDNEDPTDFITRAITDNAVTPTDTVPLSNPLTSAITELTAVSPRNVDLVVTIEQELSLLDESRESQGVADVGDRMDQILQSIAQKVRSTSHFWSKLYELSTPSHLLYGSTTATASNDPHTTTRNTIYPDSGTEGYATPSDDPGQPPITPPKRGLQTFSDASPGGSPMRLRPAGSESSDFSPDSSPFGSRSGTPIGTPVVNNKRLGGGYPENVNTVGGIADTSRFGAENTVHPSAAPSSNTTLRKLISRHSSRSLVMSRSQLERGKLLELCLAVLGCSAQWHLQLLANRPRFALSAMLRCADLLMCNNQLTVAAKRLEEALQCGLLAPVAAYICGTSGTTGSNGTRTQSSITFGDAVGEALSDSAGITDAFDRSVNISVSDTVPPAHKHKSIFQQCLAEEQLHQQQYTQHLHTILSLSINHSIQYPLYGAWTPLWHYTLRKLLYCLQQNRNYTQYRIVIANLLIPTSADGVNRLPMQPSSLLEDLLKEFIELSNIPSLETRVSADRDIQDVVPGGTAAVEGNDNTHGIPQPLPPLHLPFSNYFDVQIGMVELNTTSGEALNIATLPPAQVSGYEVIREEWLQTTAVQIEGGFVGSYSVPIKLTCNLPGPMPVDAFYMVYKRFTADTIVHEMLNQDSHTVCVGLDAALAVSEGEYMCTPAVVTTTTNSSNAGKLTIQPGTTSIHMQFTPPTLGDYRLDRIVIIAGTAIFERTFLPSITAATLHTYSYVANDSMEESEHYHYDSSRVYSAGESAALAILKEYFQQHSIVQVLPPANLLNLQSVVAPIVPLDQIDDAYFSLEVASGEVVTDLTFKAWGREFDPQKSLSFNRAFDDSRSVSINTSLRSQDMSPLMHAHKSHSKAAFTTSNSGSYTFSNNANNAPNTNANTVYSGFVSAKDATPAARRVRRAPPIDTDELEALQQANAAVASLLAQQGKARDIYRSNDSGDSNGVVVTVKRAAEWTVLVSDRSVASASDVIITSSTSDSDDQVASFAAGSIHDHKTLHVRIPFVASLQSHQLTSSAPNSVVLVLEMTGTLVRGGCTIPICVTREAVLHISELIDMNVEVYPLYPTAVENVYNMLLQCHLHNNAAIPIELTGYGLASQQAQLQSVYALLDGPTSLAAAYVSHVSQDKVVALSAGESYPAGLLLAVQTTVSSNTDDATTSRSDKEGLQFYYQRNPDLLLSLVYKEVYKHRVFTVQRALTQSKSDTGVADVTAGSMTSSSIVVPPYSGNGVALSLCTQPSFHMAVGTSAAEKGLVSVKLGKVFSCQYTLTIRCPAKGEVHQTNSGGTAHYANVLPTLLTTSDGINIAQLTRVTSLSAALCETSDWMVAGCTCRVLTTHCVNQRSVITNPATASSPATATVAPSAPVTSPNTQEVGAVVKRLVQRIESRSFDKTSTETEGHVEGAVSAPSSPTKPNNVNDKVDVKWIEVSYELSWDMLPVSLGAASLPPLKVEYKLSDDTDITTSVVYPDKMGAEDRVLVIPASREVIASGNRRNVDGCGGLNRDFTCAMVQLLDNTFPEILRHTRSAHDVIATTPLLKAVPINLDKGLPAIFAHDRETSGLLPRR